MILVEFGPCGGGSLTRPTGSKTRFHTGLSHTDRPKPQRIHHRYGPRAHGENVTQNAADARSRTLKRLNKRRMIVRLDLERARPAVADVNNAGILARPLHHHLAASLQPRQGDARRLVVALLAPHHAENAELGPRRFASAPQLFDFLVLVRSKAVLPDHLRRTGWNRRGGHHGETLLSHVGRVFTCGCRISGQEEQLQSRSCGPRSRAGPETCASHPHSFATPDL